MTETNETPCLSKVSMIRAKSKIQPSKLAVVSNRSWTPSDAPSPETIRTIRAMMVLERIRTPEAKNALEMLAKGAPGARETEEAKASLERLTRRTPRIP